MDQPAGNLTIGIRSPPASLARSQAPMPHFRAVRGISRNRRARLQPLDKLGFSDREDTPLRENRQMPNLRCSGPELIGYRAP